MQIAVLLGICVFCKPSVVFLMWELSPFETVSHAFNVGFKIITVTLAVTSKWSPGSSIDSWRDKSSFFLFWNWESSFTNWHKITNISQIATIDFIFVSIGHAKIHQDDYKTIPSYSLTSRILPLFFSCSDPCLKNETKSGTNASEGSSPLPTRIRRFATCQRVRKFPRLPNPPHEALHNTCSSLRHLPFFLSAPSPLISYFLLKKRVTRNSFRFARFTAKMMGGNPETSQRARRSSGRFLACSFASSYAVIQRHGNVRKTPSLTRLPSSTAPIFQVVCGGTFPWCLNVQRDSACFSPRTITRNIVIYTSSRVPPIRRFLCKCF